MSVVTPHETTTQVLKDMEALANKKQFLEGLGRACHYEYLRGRFMEENGITNLRPDKKKRNRRGRR